MPCSNCGESGHNSRTCPNNGTDSRDGGEHALWVKFDGISEEEADNLLKSVIDAKRKVAPHARGTFAKGSRRELPNRINEALRIASQDEDEDE